MKHVSHQQNKRHEETQSGVDLFSSEQNKEVFLFSVLLKTIWARMQHILDSSECFINDCCM